MTLSRYARSGLLLLLLSVIGAGLYLYQNLGSILHHQVRQSLQEYGVEDYKLERPRLVDGLFKVDWLWLRGSYDNHTYEAALTSLAIHYNWRVLLSGKVQSVSLSNLDITVHQTTSTPILDPDPGPTEFDIESLLPQTFASQLPLQALDIREWKVDYRSPEILNVVATGNLLYRGHLEVAAETTLGGSDITVALRTG